MDFYHLQEMLVVNMVKINGYCKKKKQEKMLQKLLQKE